MLVGVVFIVQRCALAVDGKRSHCMNIQCSMAAFATSAK